jgi:hypothetical protein
MSDPVVDVERVAGLIDADESRVTWAAELRADAGEREVAALLLENGKSHALEKSNPLYDSWSRFLTARNSSGDPVYVESDPDTRLVRRVLAPIERHVMSISPRAENKRLAVAFHMAPSMFYLEEGHPRFADFIGDLVEGLRSGTPLLVTTDPTTHAILDVRGVRGGAPPQRLFESVISEEESLDVFHKLADFLTNGISGDAAAAEFGKLAGQPQIPFDYPDDCCYARAHEMCRIMRADGIQPRKVWNYGHNWPREMNLRVETKNHPDGYVRWLYHVAPIVAVQSDRGAAVDMVMDPALFNRPVPVNEWVTIQQDKTSLHEITADIYFYRTPGNKNVLYDVDASHPFDMTNTNQSLATHRYYRDLRKNGG